MRAGGEGSELELRIGGIGVVGSLGWGVRVGGAWATGLE
jgi:hypothetical protein